MIATHQFESTDVRTTVDAHAASNRHQAKPLRLCVVSFKPCWQDETGRWMSSGGFPLQMRAIGSLFDEMTLVILRSRPLSGGMPLPEHAQVVAIDEPPGADTRRKIAVAGRLPSLLAKIARHIRSADVVHSPVPGDISVLGMLVALALRKPLFARYCSSWPSTRTTLTNRSTKRLMRAVAGGRRNLMVATGVGDTAPAEGMEWIFSTALSRQEIDHIAPDLERGLSSPPRAAYVGRLAHEKGVDLLIRAIALLDEQVSVPPQLTLLGDGPKRGELEALSAKLGCEHLVQFAGQVDRAELTKRLSQVDFLIQPSRTEGYSKAWLDAMAHGLPVVAANVGAASQVIGTTMERGWLVAPEDPVALATRIRQVITQPVNWPALRHRCRAFSQDRTLEAWAETIGRMMADRWNLRLSEGKLVR